MKRTVFVFVAIAMIPNLVTAQQNPFEALREGMKLHSDSLMRVFFEAWYLASEPQRKEITTPVQKVSEEIVEFLSNELTKNRKVLAPYMAINPVIRIYVDSSERPVDSLQNMFPKIFMGSKTLVYDRTYFEPIDRYLGWRNKEMEYVGKFTELTCHEGGCGVMFEPYISSIRFTKGNQEAIVRCAISEEGWDYTVSKTNGQWKITGQVMKWIE